MIQFLLTVSGGLQYQKLFVSLQKLHNLYLIPSSRAFLIFLAILIKTWNIEYCCLDPNYKL